MVFIVRDKKGYLLDELLLPFFFCNNDFIFISYSFLQKLIIIIVVVVVLLGILALIIGLSVGLK
jgi:hypothetical protein